MFSKFKVTNYRNLPDKEISFDKLNIFVGPNNSGKTNFIEAFSFLKDCIDSGFSFACRERGYTEFANYHLSIPVQVSFKWIFSLRGFNPLTYELILDIYKEGEIPSIKYERLGYDKKLPGNYRKSRFDYVEAHGDVAEEGYFAFYSTKKQKMVREKFTLSTKEIFLNQIDKLKLSKNLMQILIPRSITVASEIKDFVNKWFIYRNANIDIGRTKMACRRDETAFYLNNNASNLSQVFFNLQNDEKYYYQTNNIIFRMRQILPELVEIKSILRGDYVELIFFFKGARRGLRLSEISEGTVRMLILALILFHPEPPVLVMIDEPELNLHPAWLRVLAEWIKDASEKTQIIFSTHSPDLLDRFTDMLDKVYVFEKNDIRKLNRKKLEKFLDEGWELGDLYRVGEPAIGGWPW